MDKLRERILNLKEQRISSGNSTWDDCEPIVYLLKRDVLGALDAEAALRQQTPAVGGALTISKVHLAISETQRRWDKELPMYYAVTDVPALTAKLNELLASQPDTPPTPREGHDDDSK